MKEDESLTKEQIEYRKELKRLQKCPYCGYSDKGNFAETQMQLDQLADYPKSRIRRRYRCLECDNGWVSEWSEWRLCKEGENNPFVKVV